MSINANQQIFSVEDKLVKVLSTLSEMRNKGDADFIRSFIIDISERYINKQKELAKHIPLLPMDRFEVDYMERVIGDLKK